MKFVRLLCSLILVLFIMPGLADDPWGDDNHSFDQARRALGRGDVMPLTTVIKHLRQHSKGDIVATEYEYEFDRWVYEFKIIDDNGYMSRIHLDARDGSLVQISEE